MNDQQVAESGQQTTYLPIKTEFRHDGFDYKQVWREGDIAIYSQARPYRIMAYEVVIIRRRGEMRLPRGRIHPPSEFYPSSGEWGVYGWTLTDLESAHRKVEEIKQTRMQTRE